MTIKLRRPGANESSPLSQLADLARVIVLMKEAREGGSAVVALSLSTLHIEGTATLPFPPPAPADDWIEPLALAIEGARHLARTAELDPETPVTIADIWAQRDHLFVFSAAFAPTHQPMEISGSAPEPIADPPERLALVGAKWARIGGEVVVAGVTFVGQPTPTEQEKDGKWTYRVLHPQCRIEELRVVAEANVGTVSLNALRKRVAERVQGPGIEVVLMGQGPEDTEAQDA